MIPSLVTHSARASARVFLNAVRISRAGQPNGFGDEQIVLNMF